MNEIISTPFGGKTPATMSSREIADLTGKDHKNIIRDIRVMLEALKDGSDLSHVRETKDTRGYTAEIHLDRDLTMTLVSGYDIVLRNRIIRRLAEMEAKPLADPMVALNDPATMRGLLLSYSEKVIELNARVEVMQEDVDAHARLTKADGSVNITEAAKNLGLRPKALFDWLKHNGWIYKRPGASSWLGKSTQCNTGLLEHKTTTVLRADGSEKIVEQVRITAKGLSRLAKLIPPTARLVA